MKFRSKGAAVLGLALSSALMLGACTSGQDPETTPEPGTSDSATMQTSESAPTETGGTTGCLQDVGITETTDGQVSFTAGPGNWSGYNSVTSATYSTYNSVIANQMFSGFVYFGTDGTICEDKDFGSLEVVSEDPLQVKYTISDAAVWSDGTPVTINDFLLDYTAQNPEWLVPGYANGKDEKAEPLFDHVSNSFAADAPEGPEGEVGAKEFTVTFANKNPDYKLIVTAPLPAHVAAKQSGLEPDALAKAILDRDAETVKKVAKFWNTGWAYNPGELPDLAQTPSSGRYILKEGGWQADTALTLVANDKYWGKPAGMKNMIFRFIDDAQMAQALQNGDVQVISPQATVDTVAQLKNIGESVKVDTNQTLTWEHIDFNFRDTNEFSDAKGGLALREAFALCVPRQSIVDSLIKPINPDAVVMNARERFPFQDDYADVVKASYDGRYDAVDIEAAKAKIAESGVATPVNVRIGYRAGNQRRAETVAAIQASCKDAGFNVTDNSSADFFEKDLVNGDYEVALFAWAGSGQIASGQNIYSTGLPQNYGEYSNKDVDAAWKTLAGSLDKTVQEEQVKVIEKLLWDTLYGLPIYAHPGVVAYDSRVENVRPTSGQDGVSWNGSQWVVK
ncbi:ABC transporter substrate-binding protein [Tessaracoccus antarcticus]|uniref:ABC transporter family substrate-binding protein n=1 Tax=Tessaracoccus antarcticus TaxID=2479848 RepID=A0A3M0G0B3_9ACTN|nr:ABC transporter substrate-binding protein [Tessaracoccus antarcticus]RMB58364.1 ABC transporter family substrate-binding protein [Tessaracoccus antarcticus]